MNDGHERHEKRLRSIFAVTVIALGIVIAVLLTVTGTPRHHAGGPSRSATQPPSTESLASPRPSRAGHGPRAQPAPGTPAFGASVGGLFTPQLSGHGYTVRMINAQLQALRVTGATVARSVAPWETVEPQPPLNGSHRYDWAFDDAIAGSLSAHGLQWLLVIAYSAPWARLRAAELHSPPRSASDYAAYAAALAARYGHGGSFWSAHPDLVPDPVETYEIWNEPDNPSFWSPTPDARQYVDLYLRARNAITAVDPRARVIVGGLIHPSTFLPTMITARPDLRGHIDGVGIHPYGPTPLKVIANVRAARRVLRSLGLGEVPLYVTEFGWSTHPTGGLTWAPERLRPAYISRTLVALGRLDCGVAMAVLYAWISPERKLSRRADWYGIHPPNGGNSPDVRALSAGGREVNTPRGQGACG